MSDSVPPALDVLLLGSPVLRWQGQELDLKSRKGVALLALAAMSERPIPRAELAELLWGPGRLKNLRQALYVLRSLPGAEHWWVSDDPVVILAQTDVQRFRESLEAGASQAALDLRRGSFLEGLDGVGTRGLQEWIEGQRLQLEADWEDALVATVEELLAAGRGAEGEELVARLLQSMPQEGRAHRLAVEVEFQARGAEAALRRLESARRLLQRQEQAVIDPQAWDALEARLQGESTLRWGSSVGTMPARLRRLSCLLLLDPDPLPEAVLCDILGRDLLELVEDFDELEAAGWTGDSLLVEQARPLLEASLSTRARSLLHGRLAQALSESDASPLRTGRHWEAAGESAKAASCFLRLGLEAGESRWLERALRLSEDPDARREVLVGLLEDALQGGRTDEVEAWQAQLDELALHSQDPKTLSQAAHYRALRQTCAGEIQAAIASASESLGIALEHDDLHAAGRARLGLAAAQLRGGLTSKARASFEQVRRADDPTQRVEALNGLGAACAYLGELDEAEELHRLGLAEARRIGDIGLTARLLNSLGADASRRSDYAEACVRYAEVETLADRIESRHVLAVALLNHADILQRCGRLGASRPRISQALGLARDVGLPRVTALARRLRGSLERRCGRFEEAAEWAEAARQDFLEAGDPVQARVSDFNAALARCLDGEVGQEARALEVVRDLRGQGREDLAHWASLELALATDALDTVQELLDAASAYPLDAHATLLVAMIRQQLAVLRGGESGAVAGLSEALEGSELVDKIEARGLLARALGSVDSARAEQLRARARTQADQNADGLLPSQSDSYLARVEDWLRE